MSAPPTATTSVSTAVDERPAPPPSQTEIERKLSVKSAARPDGSPKKKLTARLPSTSGNDSDSSATSSAAHPVSPNLPSAGLGLGAGAGTLSAIAEAEANWGRGRPAGAGSVGIVEEAYEDEVLLEDEAGEGGDGEGEEGEGEGEGDSEDEQQGDLSSGMEGERVLRAGFLWKKQERRKVWKRKWFVLRTNKLAYYKDEREYSLSRVIDLPSVHTVAPVAVKKHSFAFGIVTSKRTFFAKASSADEMDEWVRAINGARRRMSEKAEEDARRARGEATQTQAHAQALPRSPVATKDDTGSYFAPRQPAQPHLAPQQLLASPLPPSPLDTTNNLTAQLAGLGVRSLAVASPATSTASATASASAPASAPPPSAAMVNRRLSNPIVPAPSLKARTPSLRRDTLQSNEHGALGLAPPLQDRAGLSSDEDEDVYFSDPHAAFRAAGGAGSPALASSPSTSMAPSVPAPHEIDPKKVILASYLTKQSKWRGRKVWKKRWFVLTSQGLTYCKSHMDTKQLRYIPLSSILDALDADSSSSSDAGPALSRSPTQRARQKVERRPSGRHHSYAPSAAAAAGASASAETASERVFRLITSTRTYVLCAPSEEDIIKWIAAVRALLNRERQASGSGMSAASGVSGASVAGGAGSAGGAPLLPIQSATSVGPAPAALYPAVALVPDGLPPHLDLARVPMLTQQPPTPGTPGAALLAAQSGPSGVGLGRAASPAGQGQGQSQAGSADEHTGRERSATVAARSAVADAARRYRDGE